MNKNTDSMTVGEAAEYLGVSSQTIRNWTKAGHLATSRHPINQYRYYQRSALESLRQQIAGVPVPPQSQGIHDINWDFPDSNGSDSVHSVHPYPAKFIPEIPRSLIKLFPPRRNSAVFDPFCGCGTTLVEAQREDFASIGVDLNPIACLLSRVKTTGIPVGLSETAREVVALAKASGSTPPADGSIPRVDHWFTKQASTALTGIRQAIKHQPAKTHDALHLTLSSIIVRVSNQESDTRYAAITKRVATDDVYRLFVASADRIAKHVPEQSRFRGKPTSSIIMSDILAVTPRQIPYDIGLVVTSPPYPNAYEYWLYHKYRMYWLGYDPLDVKDHEIGARAHYFKKAVPSDKDFMRQMAHIYALIKQRAIPGAHICFVIGRSVVHGREIDNARILMDAATSVGLTHVANFDRSMNSHRKSFNLSHANIKKETIVVHQVKL